MSTAKPTNATEIKKIVTSTCAHQTNQCLIFKILKIFLYFSDKVSRISTFISNDAFRNLESKAETVPAGKESTFALIMRRDFSNMELVCRSTNCVEDSFEIPKVKSE